MSWDSIFKAYDIRGKYGPGGLSVDRARAIGAAFGAFTGAKQIAVGRDCRLTSPDLAAGFIDGVCSAGVDVLDLGAVPTDVVYFASGSRGIPGAMITASHNPPEDNGIKLCGPGAAPIGADSGLVEIRAAAEADPPRRGEGTVRSWDPMPGYTDHMLSVVDPTAIGSLRVTADGGNGMAGVAIPRIFARLAAELDGMYLEPDGTFPNHHPDPLRPENLVDLQARIVETKPDLGVAFDGDADRAFFIDDLGVPVPGSTTTALIARWFLANKPGSAIVHNLICSRAVPEVVTAAGGVPIRTRVGHSYIKQVMAESGAVFGGEHSGHYYFRDNFRADSGTLALLVLLQVLSESAAPLSELRLAVEPYAQSGEINLVVEEKLEAMERVVAVFPDAEADYLDGVTLSWDDRWFNLRPSNTEPVLRLNVEAADSETVTEIVDSVVKAVSV